jgi:orotidine-5'-phosphate decarboxylase
MKPKDRLIVALDVTAAAEALDLVRQLQAVVGMFKVGSQLFTSAGPNVVEQIIKAGNKVFLDLKFHDIPHQVSGSVRSATELGVSMLTIHAAGGPEMMKRATETAKEAAERQRTAAPSIVAVTVLTSLDSKILSQIGFNDDATATAKRLASLAAAAGMDGVVASPQEITAIRSTVTDRDFLVVTPEFAQPNPHQTMTKSALRVRLLLSLRAPLISWSAGQSRPRRIPKRRRSR